MRFATVRATRLVVTALGLVALCACSGRTLTFGNPADGEIEITVVDLTCTVATNPPEYAVIDYPTDQGKPTKVKFKVKKARSQKVSILAKSGQAQPLLFGMLPRFERFATEEQKETGPKFAPTFTNGQAIFRYGVVVDTVECIDPDICIRQNGSGCNP